MKGQMFWQVLYMLIRVGLGVMMVLAGLPKMIAGPELRGEIGSVVGSVGIQGGYVFRGFMAAFAELVGGVVLILGLLTIPAAILIFITMFFAVLFHAQSGMPIFLPMVYLILAEFFILRGAGKYSLDKKLGICPSCRKHTVCDTKSQQ